MLKEEKKYYIKAFLIAFITALLIILPSIIKYKGIFMYYSDFNVQQIPFNMKSVRNIHNGLIGWDWGTDLGVSFLCSYGGVISSPLFWIMALFPYKAAPYLMGPILAIKFGLCSLTSFFYIKRFVKSYDYSLIGALLYAFSGFSLQSIVFLNFHEPMYLFPLLLIALEEAVINKRRVVFCLTVALCAVINTYFFYGMCIFLVIYFIVRLKQSDNFKINVKDFFCLAFESIVGVMIAGVTFIPAVISTMEIPRVGNILTGIDFMFFEDGVNYGVLLETLFFPAEMMPEFKMFQTADLGYPSLAAYLPLFSMAGVIGFIKGSKRDKWLKTIIIILLIVMFVPGLNSIFSLFNSTYFTRWLFMALLLCCVMTSRALEDENCNLKFGFNVCAFFVISMSLLVTFYPERDNTDITYSDGTVVHVDEIRPHFMKTMTWKAFYIIIPAVIFLIVLYFILKNRKQMTDKAFINTSIAGVIICSLTLGYINMYRADEREAKDNELIIDLYDKPLEIEDDEFYRIISEVYFLGLGVINEIGSPISFITTVPAATFEIYDTIGIERTNYSLDWEDCYAWYALTNSKYLIIEDHEKNKEYIDKQYKGFEYYGEYDQYDILRNENVLPVGYTYDNYIPYDEGALRVHRISEYESYYITDRIMVSSVLLTPEQIEKYSHVLSEADKNDMEDTDFDFERFKKDSADRRATAIADFNIDEKGNFTAKTNYEEDELVVFSIPYDDGWSCKVNGEPVEIDKVNGGFMAVYLEAGENELSFEYNTPGLKEGALLSGAGIVLVIIWFAVWHSVEKKKKAAIAEVESEEISEKESEE